MSATESELCWLSKSSPANVDVVVGVVACNSIKWSLARVFFTAQHTHTAHDSFFLTLCVCVRFVQSFDRARVRSIVRYFAGFKRA